MSIGTHIQIQKRLLCHLSKPGDHFLHEKPDDNFLLSLSTEIGSQWPSLIKLLSLSDELIVRLKELEGFSQQGCAFQLLKVWASNGDATYGQLYSKLMTIHLFDENYSPPSQKGELNFCVVIIY